MKIEKISDNQIRCTLTKEDLAARELKLSELAYGTEKAKSLFHDMMQQAEKDYGFEADDAPLMIEAIPASSDSIILIITKVDNPDELDSKFARFSTNLSGKTASVSSDKLEGAEEILDLLGKVKKAVAEHQEDQPKESTQNEKKKEEPKPGIRIFAFSTLDSVIHAAHLLNKMYHGANVLYKDPRDNAFILVLSQSDHTTADYNKLCNMFSEYGSYEKVTSASLAYLDEHCELIIESDAVHQLASI